MKRKIWKGRSREGMKRKWERKGRREGRKEGRENNE
jgi:hypothetical protein